MTEPVSADEDNFSGHVTQKAVVFNDESVLLVRSAADNPWSIPGGRVQYGEDAADGVAREIREETGLEVDVGRPVQTVTELWHLASGDPLFTVVYGCTTDERAVTLDHEHEEHEWVPVAEARDRLPVASLRTAVDRARDDVLPPE
ncbi:MAG: NUDIX domain-containing protein [Halopenitus sp.]